ncbi:TerB family tellurite resistance protein [Pedobacter sp. KR3-3]|uniref:TerB family tellurite resistance protein n=1 Tax=Pedobacter albus TaxID=3113905 RepID=A0ABU7IAA9_9SPHI|nr:TerB family tellurite resistance protein [Pedobacter sp. KR3-3]MEE1946403.1 TerB family tellurite resistance protein [Pedobacter sp. KR3-3]
MKKITVLLTAFCCLWQLHLASAQSAEVQQLALNIEKLAQFKQILQEMKRGYETVSRGYTTIKDLSEGNFNLHQAFLDGLLEVSPGLRRYRKVADIISDQGKILTEYQAAFSRFRQSGHFSPEELGYIGQVYENLFDRSLQDLDELAMVITSGKLRMSDEERIGSIDRLYADMKSNLTFLRRFNRQTAILDAKRGAQQKEAEQLRRLYGQ